MDGIDYSKRSPAERSDIRGSVSCNNDNISHIAALMRATCYVPHGLNNRGSSVNGVVASSRTAATFAAR